VEFYGAGLSSLSLADRATLANMAPEYGATIGFFPVDDETLHYLRLTGRPADSIALVEAYCKAQGLFRTDATPDPEFTDTLALDLATVVPSLAGPKRPQDRVPLSGLKDSFLKSLTAGVKENGFGVAADAVAREVGVQTNGHQTPLRHGSVVIAAITSCTNTSNPSVMIAAGLVAKKAVERGLTVNPTVKTSLAPGSRVVMDYLDAAGLTPFLDKIGFNLVGFGCTTCIGNSGPLPDAVAAGVKEGSLVVAAVLSGNRNFEGRINPLTKANYLASPPLVVACALAGRVDLDFAADPVGRDGAGKPVYLKDIWPTSQEVADLVVSAVRPKMFETRYAEVFNGDDLWRGLPVPEGDRYAWEKDSAYIKMGPYFDGVGRTPAPVTDITGARVLAVLGDSVTTDHISPAGSIPVDSPAGKYLVQRGVAPKDFNSYGSRRGNHEVMIRGTFANIRLRNQLAPGTEGGVTLNLLTGEGTTIYDASLAYQKAGIPLMVIAGKEYGSGSSRDWAAKGTALLGVRAVIACSYERIHRSNLVEMGVLPLEFLPGETRETLGLTGRETFAIAGLAAGLSPRQRVTVKYKREDGTESLFQTVARLDTNADVEYYRQGGILPAVLRQLAA
jgi:aconitate hydratase